ncbi:MAG TPA: hypothetical protein VFK05_01810 [Polyangiaceae bacterium]|nr:hypothetical protein [Polyangiaceae bacterium]
MSLPARSSTSLCLGTQRLLLQSALVAHGSPAYGGMRIATLVLTRARY